MSTLENKILIKSIGFGNNKLFVELNTDRVLTLPLSYTKKLAKATKEELKEYRLIGNGRGIYFPLIDEDISLNGILRDFGNEIREVNISLPIILLDEIDNFAKEHHINRSMFLQKASTQYINLYHN